MIHMHAQREGEVIHAESNYVVTRTGQGALLLYLHHLILLLVRLHRPVHYIRNPCGHIRNVGGRRHMPAEHRLVLAVAVVEWRTERATGNVGLLAREALDRICGGRHHVDGVADRRPMACDAYADPPRVARVVDRRAGECGEEVTLRSMRQRWRARR